MGSGKKSTRKSNNVVRISKSKNVIRLGRKKPAKALKAGQKKTQKGAAKKSPAKKDAKKKVSVLKKRSPKVVSKTNTITPEQKVELEKLHGILSDPFIRQMLIEVGGENALVIVRNFYGSHSDEELSKNLSLRISDVRATLNRLHNEGLVKYLREKDSETGWYSYSWTLNKDRIVEWVSQYAEKANGHNGKEGVDNYFCPSCGLSSIVEFAQAHECDFRCQKCTKPLEFLEEEHISSISEMLRKGR